MHVTLLKSKIHRARVTEADLEYEGSITIDSELCRAAHIHAYERVEIYNCNNGERFATYVIRGGPGEVCLNGAAARLVQPGDVIIIASYVEVEQEEIASHRPVVVLMDDDNRILETRRPAAE